MKNLAVTATAALLLSSPASATTFAGPFLGDTVTYSLVQDQDDLFGAPTLTGNTLSFTPQGFNVESQNLGFDFEDGFLSMTIEADDGEVLDTFSFSEAGGFRLGGAPGAGTSATSVDVTTAFVLTVLETDVAGGAAGQLLTDEFTLFNADLGGGVLGSVWKGTADVDVAALASAAGVVGNVTKIQLTLNNQLKATSEDGTFAFVDKKGVSAVSITVPEPASALVMLGAGAMLLRRRVAA